ncbi:hypothetical protein [Ferruginivarius sediminum]|uniref:Uncharacterized protein n=1 Tax=Ferruginivarius sediminum TaxID=2661937 RepID=A0A369TBY6_9PROT|nr:hypothetical protein [Ferruginivarius sediminum]RDD61677.1 hypothetical protein DRB17_12170 [Ferruginivarius sediminum]
MLRKLLTIVLPIALPFVVYYLYITWARMRGAGQGQQPGYKDPPWPWLAAGGVVLMAAALIAWRVLSDPAAPGAEIVPDRYIDGQVEPSYVVEE